MPKEFNSCVANGGRVRTSKLPSGKYVRFCFLKGKSYRGETKKKK